MGTAHFSLSIEFNYLFSCTNIANTAPPLYMQRAKALRNYGHLYLIICPRLTYISNASKENLSTSIAKRKTQFSMHTVGSCKKRNPHTPVENSGDISQVYLFASCELKVQLPSTITSPYIKQSQAAERRGSGGEQMCRGVDLKASINKFGACSADARLPNNTTHTPKASGPGRAVCTPHEPDRK